MSILWTFQSVSGERYNLWVHATLHQEQVMIAFRWKKKSISLVVQMMTTEKMICLFMTSTPTNGLFFLVQEKCHFQDLEQKVCIMIINYISLAGIKRKVEIFIKTYFTTIWHLRNGLMWDHYKQETHQVKELIILLFSGTVDFSFMVDMMARRGLETCTSAALKIKNISGRKSKVMEYNLWIDLVTQLLFSKTQCSYLVAGMVMILWMISTNTVSYQTTGTKSIGQMDHHHNQGIDTLQLFVEVIFTFLVVLILTSRDSMTFISLILTCVNGWKSIQLVMLRNQEHSTDQLYSATLCISLADLMDKD